MPVTLSSAPYASDWLKGESSYGEYSSRDTGVLAAGQGRLVSGTVLGQRAADGRWLVASTDAAGATDGSQVAAGFLFDRAVDTTDGEQRVVIVARKATVSAAGLTWGPDINTAALRAAAAQQLKARGLMIRQSA